VWKRTRFFWVWVGANFLNDWHERCRRVLSVEMNCTLIAQIAHWLPHKCTILG